MWLTKKWWFLVLVLSIIGLCTKAAFWQLERAKDKERLIKRLKVGEGVITSPSDLMAINLRDRSYSVQLKVKREEASPLIYLDNRIQERKAGYEVFVEVSTIPEGIQLIVNLGWIAGLSSREQLPIVEIPGRFDLSGRWMAMTDGYLMSDSFPERVGGAVRVQSLRGILSDGVVSGMVLATGVLDRDSLGPSPRMGPEMHYGYAFQWFLMALVLTGLSAYIFRRGLSDG